MGNRPLFKILRGGPPPTQPWGDPKKVGTAKGISQKKTTLRDETHTQASRQDPRGGNKGET